VTLRGWAVIAALSWLGYELGAAVGLMDELSASSDRFGLLGWIVLMLIIVFGFQYLRFSRPARGRTTWLDALARDFNAAVAQRLEAMEEAARKKGMTVPTFVQAFIHPRDQALTYMIPIAAFAVTWAMLGARDGTMDFLTTSSQVIPVLLLALALEGHIFRLRGNRREEWTLLSFLLLALLSTGEIVSVMALLDATARGADVAMAAIVAGLVAVITVAVIGHGEAAE
jgi:hypothetical protein